MSHDEDWQGWCGVLIARLGGSVEITANDEALDLVVECRFTPSGRLVLQVFPRKDNENAPELQVIADYLAEHYPAYTMSVLSAALLNGRLVDAGFGIVPLDGDAS